MAHPIDPATHTVPELREAVEQIEEPAALAALLRAERTGDDRKTAKAAIEDRLRALGADPDQVAAGTATPEPESRPREVPDVHARGEDEPDAPRAADGGETAPIAEATAQVSGLVATATDTVHDAIATGRDGISGYETALRHVETEAWRQLSVALLVGVVAASGLYALVGGLQPTFVPSGALPLFTLTAAVGVVGLPLRWWETLGADGLAVVTGGLGLATAVLIAVGVYGAVPTVTAAVALLGYGLGCLALLGTTLRSRPGP